MQHEASALMLMASVVSTALLKEVPSLGQCRGRWTQKVVPDGNPWSANETVEQMERFRDLGSIEAVVTLGSPILRTGSGLDSES